MLADLIKTHALSAAESGDWSAVAETIRGLNLRAAPRICYSVESGDAIEAAGDDPTTVLGWMTQDPNGTMLFQRLSSAAGVQWAHPRTQQWLTWFVNQGRISQAGADALISLSAPYTYLELTAEQCRVEWLRSKIQPLWVARSAVVAEGIHDGTITTVQQILAVISGELEAD